MSGRKIVTVVTNPETADDGSTHWIASTEEWPGVVAVGETREAAENDLVALLRNLRERMGLDALGVRTKVVSIFSWHVGSIICLEAKRVRDRNPEPAGMTMRTV